MAPPLRDYLLASPKNVRSSSAKRPDLRVTISPLQILNIQDIYSRTPVWGGLRSTPPLLKVTFEMLPYL